MLCNINRVLFSLFFLFIYIISQYGLFFFFFYIVEKRLIIICVIEVICSLLQWSNLILMIRSIYGYYNL